MPAAAGVVDEKGSEYILAHTGSQHVYDFSQHRERKIELRQSNEGGRARGGAARKAACSEVLTYIEFLTAPGSVFLICKC